MPEIHGDELVRCPLCAGDGFLTHADKSTTVCALCSGRRLLHEEFVAACRSVIVGAPLAIWYGCDVCGSDDVKGAMEYHEDYEVQVCYACFCQRGGIVLPVYEAGEAEPF